jgi:hypothetical protein
MLFNPIFSPFKVPGDFSNITVCACTKIARTDVPVGNCICGRADRMGIFRFRHLSYFATDLSKTRTE